MVVSLRGLTRLRTQLQNQNSRFAGRGNRYFSSPSSSPLFNSKLSLQGGLRGKSFRNCIYTPVQVQRRNVGTFKVLMRLIPVRLLALPLTMGAVGAQGYEHLRKNFVLPDLGIGDTTDKMKSGSAKFLGGLFALFPTSKETLAKSNVEPIEQSDYGQHNEQSESGKEPPVSNDNSNSQTALPPPKEDEEEEESEEEKALKRIRELEEYSQRLQEALDDAHARHQEEFMEERSRLQDIIDDLEGENNNLRVAYLHLHNGQEKHESPNGNRKKTSIEMYSEVLDLLSKYHKSYDVADHLPRVVVVGDQSAGKTSVLEMLAQARMFPRGSGEMMTRTPIQVTLFEGPKRIAGFADSNRKFDLTSEAELEALRKEVYNRMVGSITNDETVSGETVSMYVQGPGLPRMVLVDLPGIINHVTAGMAGDTKNRITEIARKQMSNPNAIILCVQDGSVDAERSSVADLVSSVDPTGKRTVFVLTKVDVAEANNTATQRIRSIMEGRLFKMNALGYFAVVTGKGTPNETIDEIKEYEEDFFKSSRLFRDGALKPHQTTISNLSRAVSKEFWALVRESVEEQCDNVKSDLVKKEMEWKNKYKGRLMTRDELFQLGKHEILENVAHFGSIGAKEWELMLAESIWDNIESDFMNDIYLSAAKSRTTDFRTRVDVQLLDWARRGLPSICVDITRDRFIEEFETIVLGSAVDTMQDSNEIFATLKETIVKNRRMEHVWSSDVNHNLKVIQVTSLEDDEITDIHEWQSATQFMMEKLNEKNQVLSQKSQDYFGPEWMEQLFYWRSRKPLQAKRAAIRHELAPYFQNKENPNPKMDHEEIVTCRTTVQKTRNMEVTDEMVQEVFDFMYTKDFVDRSIKAGNFCKHAFNYSDEKLEESPNGLQCHDVMMFWRMQEMLRVSSKALRQQVMAHKSRLEQEVKEELEAMSTSELTKRNVINGQRVELAEQIEITRHIYNHLDKFIRQLSSRSNREI